MAKSTTTWFLARELARAGKRVLLRDLDPQQGLRDILRDLFGHGYTGYCEVELLGEEIESAGYHAILANARDWFDELCATDAA